MDKGRVLGDDMMSSSQCNEKPLEGFKKRNDIMWLRFLKDHADCRAENGMKGLQWKATAVVQVSGESLDLGQMIALDSR